MKKIDGVPLSKIKDNIFPATAIERFNDMIFKLGDNAIMHSYFNMGNVLYDAKTNIFNPVDLTNDYDSYFSDIAKISESIPMEETDGTLYELEIPPLRTIMNQSQEVEYNDYIKFITEHMANHPPYNPLTILTGTVVNHFQKILTTTVGLYSI